MRCAARAAPCPSATSVAGEHNHFSNPSSREENPYRFQFTRLITPLPFELAVLDDRVAGIPPRVLLLSAS